MACPSRPARRSLTPAENARPPRGAGPDDRAVVTRLLGREPLGDFEVVLRDRSGVPVVIRNSPVLHDGTPMPTRFWLVGPTERKAVDRLEAAGGVREAERTVGFAAIETAHRIYEAERQAEMPPRWGGPLPKGGVGGTRRGVKCLHAHYAWFLVGGPDPVGLWVARQLAGAVTADLPDDAGMADVAKAGSS